MTKIPLILGGYWSAVTIFSAYKFKLVLRLTGIMKKRKVYLVL